MPCSVFPVLTTVTVMRGGAAHDVVVGEDLAVGGEDHAGACGPRALVAEDGVDVDDADLLVGARSPGRTARAVSGPPPFPNRRRCR